MPRFVKMSGWKPATLLGAMSLVLLAAGCGGGGSSSGSAITATPTFSPNGGTFGTSQAVTVGDTTPGAVLYCTTDGSAPTTSSPVCGEPTTVAKSETLSAIAIAPGYSASPVAKQSFTISLNPVATPVISPGGGVFNTVQSATISDATAGAIITYTTDGSNPASSATAATYTAPISVTSTQTINAIATAGTARSALATAAFAIDLPRVAPPAISPDGGTFAASQTVTITDTNPAAVIYFTTDGSTPTSASPVYSGAITVATSETVSALAVTGGVDDSAISSATFTIGGGGGSGTLPTPVITPPGGSFNTEPVSVTITDTNATAQIYYTTDGSQPGTTSATTLYTGAIALTTTATINAIATESGFTSSSVVTANFNISLAQATAPTGNVASGTYTSAQALTLSDTQQPITIYYGSFPLGTTCSNVSLSAIATLYSTPINVNSSETLCAYAIATGYSASPVLSLSYVINLPSVLTPQISPAGGTLNYPTPVFISSAVQGAAIYYTTDGSTPTTSSALYTGPITAPAPSATTAAETINAIATASGFAQSQVATASYTFVAASPNFSSPPGTFTAPVSSTTPSLSVTITDPTPAASLYYTTDGSTPTTSSTAYTAALSLTSTANGEVLSAIASAPPVYPASGSSASSGAYSSATQVGTIDTNPANLPTFSPAQGAQSGPISVSINENDGNGTVYYSTNGFAPTTGSNVYSGTPITVSGTQTILAFSYDGNTNKYTPLASATYTFTGGEPAPVILGNGNPLSATNSFSTPQQLSFTDNDPNATIYYTLDGSTPSATNGINYSLNPSGPTIYATTTVNAVAISASSVASTPVTSAVLTMTVGQVPTPTISPNGGSFSTVQTVTVTDGDPNANLYYSSDTTTWTEIQNGSGTVTGSSIAFSVPVNQTETLYVIASDPAEFDSQVASANFTLSLPATASPTLYPGPGNYGKTQTVFISDATPGSTIYYTLDGSTPNPISATPYTGPITVSATETVLAIANGAPGYNESSITPPAGGLYTISSSGSLTLSGTVTAAGSAVASGIPLTLYAAGTGGYGSAGTSVASATTTTGGAFSFANITCPAAPGDQLYIVASVSSNVKLMEGLGSCGNISTSSTPTYTVNEATTIASAYALSGFASASSGGGLNIGAPTTNFDTTTNSCPTGSVGNATCNYIGLANAFNTIGNLVNLNTGAVLSITPYYATAGGSSGGPLNSSYVPQARIQTLAGILAACTGNSGNCSSLFSKAHTLNGNAPGSTLQAALSIAQNPGYNVGLLYGLASSPALTSAPNDWTIALTFAGAGLGWPTGFEPGSTTVKYNPSNALQPNSLSIDAAGNVWAAANSSANIYAVVEFNNLGWPLSPNAAGDFANPESGVTAGYQNTATAALGGSEALAIDQTGNVWFASDNNSGTSLLAELTPTGNSSQAPYPAQGAVNGLAIDKLGNPWESSTSTDCELAEYSGQDGAQQFANVSGSCSNSGFFTFNQLAFDPFGTLWTDSTTNFDSDSILGLDTATGSQGNITASPASLTFTPLTSAAYGLAIDNGGNVFAPTVPGTIAGQYHSGSTSSCTYALPANAIGVETIALDGAGNVWGAAYSAATNTNTTAGAPSFLVQCINSGTALSGTASEYTGTGATNETQPILSDYRTGMSGIAVDGSGNVWVTNTSLPNKNFPNPPAEGVGEQLVEFVGIAAPVVTPTSVGLANNALASKP